MKVHMNSVQRLTSDVVGTPFVKGLHILETANDLRRTDVAPGMVSYLERALLTNLVAQTWQGEGAIIDAGSFFGASIVAAADGMRAGAHADQLTSERFPQGRPIHGYDIGFLPRPKDGKDDIRSWNGVEYRAGENFVPILEKAVAPYPDLVELHIGDLYQETWPEGAPIEIAFIDVSKTAVLSTHLAQQFYPSLIPGGSTLIHRDFFFDRNPWLKVTMGHLKDYFSWEGQVQSSSVVRTVKAVPADVAAYNAFDEATYEECLALHDAVEYPGLHPRFEFRMRLSRAHLMSLKGHKDDALDTLREVESEYADLLGDGDIGLVEKARLEQEIQHVSAGTFRVKGESDAVEKLARDVVGSRFVRDLDVVGTANVLRTTEVAPGMISYLERAMLTNLVATTWRGEGAIIDGGSFFGSSIVALAEGVRGSEVQDGLQLEGFWEGKPIHGYELGFLPLPDGWDEQVRVWHGIEYRFGESFVPILEKAAEPYQDLVRLHIGDLTEESWPHDAPIEIAFIDVCKSIQLNAHVSKEFYPALIPGASTLINQDFFFDRLPWIKVTMGYLKDYFSWEGQVLSSSIYRSVKAVPADVAAFDPFLEASHEECLEMHDAVEFPGLDRRFEFRMDLSRAYLMTLKGHKDDALDSLKELESLYADQLGDVDAERGQQFRFDRAVKQISNDMIFKVSHTGSRPDPDPVPTLPDPALEQPVDAVEKLAPDVVGSRFVRDLDVVGTANALRTTEVAPGMISYLERAMLTNLVARTWRGEGAIIDGGSFFGSSIVALAEGVRGSEVQDGLRREGFWEGKPIHGYELGFLPLPEGRDEQVRVWHGIEYRFGESFVPILEKAAEPYQDLVRLHIGDLTEESWPHDAPIEIAFIDVCKSIQLNAHVSKEFYPALIPGASTLINQDFFFDRLPWIKVTMGYLKDYFSWEGQVLSSSIYRSVKAVPADVAAFDPFLEASYEECLEMHDAVEFPGLDRRFEFRMDLSRAYLMALKGHKDEALDTLKGLESLYADQLGDVDAERGQQFRFDRAVKQITNDMIFKVS
jgi:hypothetical protein